MKTIYEISTRDGLLASHISVADHFLSRFLGLMGKPFLPQGEGLLLRNCSSIHCCFMRFPIDVVYLNFAMQVVGTETVSPWQLGHRFADVRHVLELPQGAAQHLRLGEILKIKEKSGDNT